MIQKAAPMGNWWLAASSRQHAHSCSSHLMQRFLVKHEVTQVTQPPYSSDLVPCDFWLFPKLTSPLKGKRFQTIEIQGNMTEQLVVSRKNWVRSWGPKMPTLKGTEVSLSYIWGLFYLVLSSIYGSIFHITWLDTFWRPHIIPNIELLKPLEEQGEDHRNIVWCMCMHKNKGKYRN